MKSYISCPAGKSQWAGFRSHFSRTPISLRTASVRVSRQDWGAGVVRGLRTWAQRSNIIVYRPSLWAVLRRPAFKLLSPREPDICLGWNELMGLFCFSSAFSPGFSEAFPGSSWSLSHVTLTLQAQFHLCALAHAVPPAWNTLLLLFP